MALKIELKPNERVIIGDCVVTNVGLPGGSGLRLAREAIEVGKKVFVIRASRGRIEVCDRRGLVFRGSQLAVGDFLKKAVLRRSDGKVVEGKAGQVRHKILSTSARGPG